MERTMNDFHMLTHRKFKKTYFVRHPKEPKMIRTVRFHFDIFSGTPNPQYSNFNFEEPQDEWVEMMPRLMSFSMSFRHSVYEMFMS